MKYVLCATIIIYGWSGAAYSQSPASLSAAARSNSCPANLARYTPLDSNAICNPLMRETRSCDSRFIASSKNWQDCYKSVSECRIKISEENQQISEYNSFVMKCEMDRRNLLNKIQAGGKQPTSPDNQGTAESPRLAAARAKAANADKANSLEIAGVSRAAAQYDRERAVENKRMMAAYARELKAIEEAHAAYLRRERQLRDIQEANIAAAERARAERLAAEEAAMQAEQFAAFAGMALNVFSAYTQARRPSYQAPVSSAPSSSSSSSSSSSMRFNGRN